MSNKIYLFIHTYLILSLIELLLYCLRSVSSFSSCGAPQKYLEKYRNNAHEILVLRFCHTQHNCTLCYMSYGLFTLSVAFLLVVSIQAVSTDGDSTSPDRVLPENETDNVISNNKTLNVINNIVIKLSL